MPPSVLEDADPAPTLADVLTALKTQTVWLERIAVMLRNERAERPMLHVKIEDVNVPFWHLVGLIVKINLASSPVLVIGLISIGIGVFLCGGAATLAALSGLAGGARAPVQVNQTIPRLSTAVAARTTAIVLPTVVVSTPLAAQPPLPPEPTQLPVPTIDKVVAQPAVVPPSATPAIAPTKGPTIAHPGDMLEAVGYRFTLLNAETSDKYGIYEAKPGERFVAVEVLIESMAEKGVNSNALNAQIEDDQGYVYNTALGGKDPALAAENDIGVGRKLRGWITFKVPTNAKGLRFVYKPSAFEPIRFEYALGL